MSQLCYFLIYRRSLAEKRKIDWKHPTGGLVMKPCRLVHGKPVSDLGMAADVVEQRYHCGPHEEMIIAEVFKRREQRKAWELHREWEAEMGEFLELMQV